MNDKSPSFQTQRACGQLPGRGSNTDHRENGHGALDETEYDQSQDFGSGDCSGPLADDLVLLGQSRGLWGQLELD